MWVSAITLAFSPKESRVHTSDSDVVRHATMLSMVIAHNHPSGEANPSVADEALAHALIEMKVLDHFVIGAAELTSFAERGPR
jgi:DNA repair protein RadC